MIGRPSETKSSAAAWRSPLGVVAKRQSMSEWIFSPRLGTGRCDHFRSTSPLNSTRRRRYKSPTGTAAADNLIASL